MFVEQSDFNILIKGAFCMFVVLHVLIENTLL